MLGPRKNIQPPNSYVNAIFGLFMLWWGWLGFNCGSTLGITDDKWLYASNIVSSNNSFINNIRWDIFNNL